MLKLWLVTFLLLISGNYASAVSNKFYHWKKPYTLKKKSSKNEMQFTNRAQCALDSKKPTTNVFLIVNNIDIAKAFYRLQTFANDDSNVLQRGVKRFRYSFLLMLELVMKRMNEGSLPILPHDTTDLKTDYAKINKICDFKTNCAEMVSFLYDKWYEKKEGTGTPIDYVSTSPHICEDLKRIDQNQANLFGNKPDTIVLNSLAKHFFEEEKSNEQCDIDFISVDTVDQLKSDLFQIKLNVSNYEEWDKKGFDYWHSLKVYMSFAFRYTDEIQELAYPFANIITGANIEESFLFVPADCRSIDNPKCDSPYLSQQILRDFAKVSIANKKGNEAIKQIPQSSDEYMIGNKFPEVNTDILDFKDFDSSEKWVTHFQENLMRTKETLKKRLLKAANFIYFTKPLFEGDFVSKIDQKIKEATKRSLTNAEKNELYYLCHEYIFAQDESIGMLREKIELATQDKHLAGKIAFLDINPNKVFENFRVVAKKVIKTCKQIDQEEVFKDFTRDTKGFSKWYVEKVYDNRFRPEPNLYSNKDSKLIEIDSTSHGTVCYDEIDCARKYLATMIDFYAVGSFAQALWSNGGNKSSPALFNPYSERISCGVYDPWYRTKAIILNLVTDLSLAVASATTPGLIYASVGLRPGLVTSFDKLVEDGVVKYDANKDHRKINLGLTADFGPLLGAPCAVSIVNSEQNPLKYYHFRGISVGACQPGQTNHTFTAFSASKTTSKKFTHSECFSCTLNFETATASLTSLSSNVGPVYFLVRAFFRLFNGLNDPHNIPRSWTLDLDNLEQTYSKYGHIPSRCTKPMNKGRDCLRRVSCESEALDELYNKYGDLTVLATRTKGRTDYHTNVRTYIKTKECEDPIQVNMTVSHNRCFRPRVNVPRSCTLQEVK